jgi:4-hydroxybenzoate polyprenyltransferase
MNMKSLLKLVRLPNLFTAPADALAGWYLATAGDDPARGALLGGCSVLLYLGGIVLNDLCDLRVDQEERPSRPLPSGAVPGRVAWGLVLGAFPLALVLGMAGGGLYGLLAAVFLGLLVILYNAGLKKTWLGPIAMGMCRGTNVLLGASPGGDYGYPWAWGLALAITVYVVGITCISRSEARGGGKLLSGIGVGIQLIALAGLVALSRLLSAAAEMAEPISLGGLVLILAAGFRVTRAGWNGVRAATPEVLQRAVKAGVLSLSWLHAGVVLSAGGLGTAAALIGLSVLAGVAARRLYVT